MSDRIYFISDLHFGLEEKERENVKEGTAVEFLDSLNDAERLVILGDLFDYWFEYKRVMQKGYYRFFCALKRLSERGVKIDYIIGNHDFLHRDFFTKEFGAQLYEDAYEAEFFGKRFFMAHGDGLLPNDVGYKILKSVLRNKFIQKLYSLVHPDLGIKIAQSSSKKSRNYTSKKNYGEKNALLEFAKKKIDNGYDYVVLGHSHVREEVKYKDGLYVNLGSWLEKPYYGIFDGEKFEVRIWGTNEQK